MPALAVYGCARPSGLEDLPPEGVALGRTNALAPVLDALASWSDTRVSNRVLALRPQIDACPEVFSLRWPEGGPPVLTCGEDPALSPLRRAWSSASEPALLFALPDRGHGRAVGALSPSVRGGFGLDLHLPVPLAGSAWDLLIPAAEGPGPWRLNPTRALVHGRVRQDRGVDIPSLVGGQNQGETLFHLQSDLFSSAVLDRTWELAIYPPEEGHGMPRAALAVGVRSPTLAEQAAQQYLLTLARQWTFLPEPWAEGEHHGTCLRHLNLLPELEPCYAVTTNNLVISWNQASLSYALQAAEPGLAEPARSAVRVDFSLFPEADARLSEAFSGATAPQTHYPWTSMELSASVAEDLVLLHVDAVAP